MNKDTVVRVLYSTTREMCCLVFGLVYRFDRDWILRLLCARSPSPFADLLLAESNILLLRLTKIDLSSIHSQAYVQYSCRYVGIKGERDLFTGNRIDGVSVFCGGIGARRSKCLRER